MVRKGGFALGMLLILFFGVTAGWSQTSPPAFMKLSEVKAGMNGYGLTVFQGTQIDTFRVEVLGVMKNIIYPKRDLIMVRVSGPYIDRAGVIAGMSGSPVYIDGRLVGALAYSGFTQFQKDPIAAVTPIGEMLEIQAAAERDSQTSDRMGATDDQETPGSSPFAWSEPQAGVPSLLRPISVPLSVSGFDPRALSLFDGLFRRMGFIPLMGGGSGTGTSPADGGASSLVPGSAVAMQLIRGDMNIAATGTVTYRDGNTILAFGHPFLWSGPVNVPMAKAEIVTVIPDLSMSVKMGAVTDQVGAIRWDHTSGVYGIVGATPMMIPVRVNFKSGGQQKDTYQYEVMVSRAFTPFLLNMTVSNTIVTNGRLGGERTIELDGRVTMRGYPDIVLQDLFSGSVTLQSVSTSVTDVLNTVLDNPFVTPNVEAISLTMNSTDDRRTATIEGVWYDRDEVKPGSNLDLTVFLKPYRGDRIVKKTTIPIPNTLTDGDLMISVGAAQMLTQQEVRATPQRFRPQEVGQLIGLLNKRRTNNKIYIKLSQAAPGGIVKGTELPALPPSILSVMDSKRSSGSFTPTREVVLAEHDIVTNYVISGQSQIRVRVKR